MTRPYALRRLLDLGPLTLAELIDITRWPYRATQAMLTRLQDEGRVVAVKVSAHRNEYRNA
jgi:hypothetical protein